MNQNEMQALTISELYELAKQHGIPSYRKYKKAELISLLQKPAPLPKKRGRKPKSAAEPIVEATASVPAQEHPQPSAKRSPGRPPKHGKPEAAPAAVSEKPAEPAAPEGEKQQEHREPRGEQPAARTGRNMRPQNYRQNQNRPNRRDYVSRTAPYHAPDGEQKPAEPVQLPETGTAAGVLEIMEGYGFLRV